MNNEELKKAIKKYVDARLDKTYEAYGEHRQKQLSKFDAYDIEEAIEYGAKWQMEQTRGKKWIFEDEYHKDMERAFQDGRDEMREQMMKEAVEGKVRNIILHENGDEVHYSITYPKGKNQYSINDKVKIIIL